MELSIRDFAKIKQADIVIDGITVIAGENNTGKSTVGKILFSLFNSLSDIEEKIFNERMREVEKSNEKIMYEYFDGNIIYTQLQNSMVSGLQRNTVKLTECLL